MIDMDPEVEKLLVPFRAQVKLVGDRVRQLKTDGAPKADIDIAVNELTAKKKS